MRFTFNASERSAATHAAQGSEQSGVKPPKTRSTPQTRRRNDLPDTKTVTIRSMTDNDRLLNKILDADPNRELHYATPTLKRRILR